MGRPKVVWEERQWREFENLCKINATEAEICAVMGVSEELLVRLIRDKYNVTFTECYKMFSANGRASLRRKMYQKALQDGDKTMLIWLSKQYLGMSDKVENINYNVDADIIAEVERTVYED